MADSTNRPLSEGWYPDPDNEFLVRWWDGDGWTDRRQTWFVSARRGGGWFASTSANGRFVLFAATHPLLVALLTVTLYLLPGLLLPAPVTMPDVIGAISTTAFFSLFVWRSRARLRRAHRAFYRRPAGLAG
jgi:hypothetical protein